MGKESSSWRRDVVLRVESSKGGVVWRWGSGYPIVSPWIFMTSMGTHEHDRTSASRINSWLSSVSLLWGDSTRFLALPPSAVGCVVLHIDFLQPKWDVSVMEPWSGFEIIKMQTCFYVMIPQNGKIKVRVQRVYVQHQHLKWVVVYWADIWTSSGQLLRCPVPGKHHGRWSSVQTRAQFVATRVFACIFIAETSIGRRMTREVSAVLSCTHSLVRVFITQEILAVR